MKCCCAAARTTCCFVHPLEAAGSFPPAATTAAGLVHLLHRAGRQSEQGQAGRARGHAAGDEQAAAQRATAVVQPGRHHQQQAAGLTGAARAAADVEGGAVWGGCRGGCDACWPGIPRAWVLGHVQVGGMGGQRGKQLVHAWFSRHCDRLHVVLLGLEACTCCR